ncbi:hypothetical protein Patl1_25082 [Pistacia atlantica]|uniref:Uncharacterized protein n=1 Tax=Pistacia atlantica TaxID=434234 RepID=A0ACC1B2C5_9ROSI|nr:hypothetical protein Patl1_25082 [Pistacia atlantica]
MVSIALAARTLDYRGRCQRKIDVFVVKHVLLDCILLALLRMDENLADNTENLHKESRVYREAGTRIQQKMWYQNMKIKLVVLGILLALVLIIWLSVCHGFNYT